MTEAVSPCSTSTTTSTLHEHRMCRSVQFFHLQSAHDDWNCLPHRRRLVGSGSVFWTALSQKDKRLGDIPYIISFHFRSTCINSSQLVQLLCTDKDKIFPILSSLDSSLVLLTMDFLLIRILLFAPAMPRPLRSLADLVFWQNAFWNSRSLTAVFKRFGVF